MAKILECAKVDPSSGCQHIARGETEEEVLRGAPCLSPQKTLWRQLSSVISMP